MSLRCSNFPCLREVNKTPSLLVISARYSASLLPPYARCTHRSLQILSHILPHISIKSLQSENSTSIRHPHVSSRPFALFDGIHEDLNDDKVASMSCIFVLMASTRISKLSWGSDDRDEQRIEKLKYAVQCQQTYQEGAIKQTFTSQSVKRINSIMQIPKYLLLQPRLT
jgi:hypothetical protein